VRYLHSIVFDLIDGKLKGAHGVALETRRKREETFSNLFGEKATTQRNP
jgi:hypothetical protein